MRWNFQIKKRIEQTYGKSSDTFAKKETATPQKTNKKKESGFHIIYDVKELEDLLKQADNQGYFAIDTETNSLKFTKSRFGWVYL